MRRDESGEGNKEKSMEREERESRGDKGDKGEQTAWRASAKEGGNEEKGETTSEGIEASRSEVQDNPPPPTAHTVHRATPHEPRRFNWATNDNKSIGPVPNTSEFRPSTPLQSVYAPPRPTVSPSDSDVATELVPAGPTPVMYYEPSANHDREPTTSSIAGDTAPSVNELRSPASPLKPSANGCPNRSSKPPSPQSRTTPACQPHHTRSTRLRTTQARCHTVIPCK
jgi:hypothetical protein